MTRLTPAQKQLRAAQQAARSAKVNKWNARMVERDGMLFHSAKEADRYRELSLMQAGGAISGLECQVPFHFDLNGVHIADYVADFMYFERPIGALIVEDVKGALTPVYKLKRRLMLAFHSITIRET